MTTVSDWRTQNRPVAGNDQLRLMQKMDTDSAALRMVLGGYYLCVYVAHLDKTAHQGGPSLTTSLPCAKSTLTGIRTKEINKMEKSVVQLLREAAAALEDRSPSQTPDRPVTVSGAGTSARHGASGTRAEVLRLFRPYNRPQSAPCLMPKTTKKTFTHRFFCLANRRQELVPGTAEKYELEKAGLGERRLTFSDKFCTAAEFANILLSHYPALHDCGGYQLLRIRGSSRSRMLAVIDCPSNGYTPHYLCTSANIGQAIIYVRPLQKDISLQNLTQTQEDESVTQCMVTCMYCGQNFMMNHIQDHVDVCEAAHPESQATASSSPSTHPASQATASSSSSTHPASQATASSSSSTHPASQATASSSSSTHPASQATASSSPFIHQASQATASSSSSPSTHPASQATASSSSSPSTHPASQATASSSPSTHPASQATASSSPSTHPASQATASSSSSPFIHQASHPNASSTPSDRASWSMELLFEEWKLEPDLQSATKMYRDLMLQNAEDKPNLLITLDMHSTETDRERAMLFFYKQTNVDWTRPFEVRLKADSAMGDGVKRHLFSLLLDKIHTGLQLDLDTCGGKTLFSIGEADHLVPSTSRTLLDGDLFRVVGRVIGHSFINGGPMLTGLSLSSNCCVDPKITPLSWS
ncbi:uncharacterized protein LOC125722238 [Brienomyrus brachyistius]|uniref:uncharacterized protein LOC125722238 n=1 Tax=Brienomyrus brachyistius TaxID=42636 RepID=UPI0020B42FCA|nr:uncharacterized protein LOC125722238 [Brienomyrus brachyistius]